MAIVVRWFPQSWVQIRTDEHLIYLDPSNMSTTMDILAAPFSPKVRVEQLPEYLEPGDLILVTHHHIDHVRKGLVEYLSRPDTKVLAPLKCRKKLGDSLSIVKAGETVTLGDIAIQIVEAYNPPGSRRMTFHQQGECVGYVIELEGKRIYHAGDTGLIDEMNAIGPIDIAFLPIGGKFPLDIGEAVEAVKRIRPRVVVPMHMLKADPQEFKARVEKETSSKVQVLAPGGSFTLD